MNSSTYDSHQSFSTFNAPTESFSATPEAVRDTGESQSVTISNGETTVRSQGLEAYRGEAPKDWKDTARDAHGYRTTSLSDETIVDWGGLQAKIGDLVSAGELIKNQDGSYETPLVIETGNDHQGPDEDSAFLPEGAVEAINQALEGIPDGALDSATATATLAAIGKASLEDVAKAFASQSGMELTEAHDRASYVIQSYQAQTDAFLSGRAGIPTEEVPQMYEWAKTHRGQQIQAAIRGQLNGSMAEWRSLAKAYQVSRGRI